MHGAAVRRASRAGGDQEQPARPWSYLQVAPSPPGVWFRGRHAACSVGEQVLVELHSLVADRYVVSEARGPQALPAPHPDPPHLAGHVEADGHDGCVSQLKDSEHLTAHDSQRPPRHKGSPPKHILQEALGHYWGNHRKRIRVVRRGGGERREGKEGRGRKRKGGENTHQENKKTERGGRVKGSAYLGSVPAVGGPPRSSTADSHPEMSLA